MLEIITTFNDGHTRYYQGERVSESNFDPAELAKFVAYGWIAKEGAAPTVAVQNAELTLDIKDGQLGHKQEF